MENKSIWQVYDKEKIEEYRKLSAQQKLEWLEKMNRFLYYFMPKKSRTFEKKLRQGKITY